MVCEAAKTADLKMLKTVSVEGIKDLGTVFQAGI
jgi:hypothetical protein